MNNDIFSKLRIFAKKHGMQIAVAVMILGLAAVAVGTMGGTLAELRQDMAEEPAETPLPQKQQPEPLPQKEEPAPTTERKEIPAEDIEPMHESDDPVAGAAGTLPDVAEQEVFTAEFVPVYIKPLEGAVQKEFSGNTLVKSITMEDWRTHNGIDIAASPGTEALAVQSGEVVYLMEEDLWGYVVELRLDSGIRARYCGLAAPAEGIVVGARLSQGDVVGTVGTAMVEAAEEPHLHLEMLRDGEYIDPREFIG